MRYLPLISTIVVHLLIILFFSQIQDLFFKAHFSWTFSKLSAYLFTVISGLSLIFVTRKKLKSLKLYYRIPLLTVISTLGFVVAFILNPIYEGDFRKDGKKINQKTQINEVNGDFVMIALLDCPYCHEAIQTLNKIQQRNPQMKISVIVLTAHTENLKQYTSEVDKRITVKTTKDFDAITQLAGGTYPAFFQIKKGLITEVWSNDQFGTRAIDKIENEYK